RTGYCIGLVQAQFLDERSQPATVVGEFHEFRRVLKVESRRESFAFANYKPALLQSANNLSPIGWVADQFFYSQAAAGEQRFDDPAICLCLKLWKARPRTRDQRPVAAARKLAMNLRRQNGHGHEAGHKVRADHIEGFIFEALFEFCSIIDGGDKIGNPPV